jgi:exodeoxyribonuclease VII large subunit
MKPLRATPPVRSVRQVVRYIRQIVTGNKWLREIGVRGEVSNFGRSNNRVYFDLKEDDVILNCVVWSDFVASLPELKNGLAVVAVGEIDTYGQRSRYQLIAHTVTLEGVGDLHAEFEKLKKKLEAEGVFAAELKRALPRYPYRVALVSSRDARGAGDFGTIVAKRAPHVELVFVETPVQGTGASIEIADAIDRASRLDVDVIVVARGGGSFEDLFPFNTETVARAIRRARHPVVSAVGHDYDVTIADLVADVRAETPSAAAHRVVPDRDGLLRQIGALVDAVESRVNQRLRDVLRELNRTVARSALTQSGRIFGPRGQRIDRALARLERFDPSRQLAERGKTLEFARFRLGRAAEARIARNRERTERSISGLAPAMQTGHARRVNTLQLLRAKLFGHDPEAILQQGYAIVRYDGQVVSDPEAVPLGLLISAQVARGTLTARVEERSRDGAE